MRAAMRPGAYPPAPPSSRVAGSCAAARDTCGCTQWALWFLATLGCGMPIACGVVANAAERRSFMADRCRQRSCASCATAKGCDVPVLALTAALFFVSFCGAAWQLVSAAVDRGVVC